MTKYYFIILAFLTACSSNIGDSPIESIIQTNSERPEMLLINSSGKSVILDSTLTVNFTYSFFIDKHEVTCEEYRDLIKDADCKSTKLPITNITFYDAILYANAKSKSEKLDTVYSYTDAVFDLEAHCTRLSGYAFHPDRNGYRLPTEAEWVFVASQNWNPQKGWNADNSKYEIHEPCTADTTDGACDFAGNALEWVNDWKDNLQKIEVENYIGAPDEGRIGERVVKGGSFRNAASTINLENRGDIYTVTSSTMADYVGFRLAIGKIPNPVWIGNNGGIISSPINILASSTQLKSITRTYQNKLVFRNDETGNIAYINFANGSLSVNEIKDTLNAYHPAISPDGNFVAFCTKLEGVSGKSELYVRHLDSIGTDLLKLDVESAAMPRWRVMDGDTQIVYITDAGSNYNEATWKGYSTWSVTFSNGKFGTPKKLFDGSFNGGVSLDEKLAISGAKILRAKLNGKDTVWYNGEQACNASLSDSTKQTLFLDFSGKTGQNFSGNTYSTHEQLLIADSTGKLIRMIPAPKSYVFDHTEWTHNSKTLATATLENMKNAHEKIVLINTVDSSVTELLEGAELWHPDFWTKKQLNIETSLDIDSAGMYELNTPFTGDLSSTNTRYDLELLYAHRDSINVLISGSSRPWAGINPMILNESKQKIFSINAANPAVDLSVAKKILFNYGVNLLPKLKVVVVSFDLDIIFSRYYNNSNFWNNIYLHSPGFVYDESHNFWSEGYPNGLYELTKNSYGENEENRNQEQAMLGYKHVPSLGWEGNSVFTDSTLMDFVNQEEIILTEIEDFIKEAESKGLYLVGIIFPQSPDYRETGAFGRYGLRRSMAIKMIEKIQKFEEKYLHFKLMDENKMGNHDYDDSMALNFDHLSYIGATQLTNRLDSLLQTLMP